MSDWNNGGSTMATAAMLEEWNRKGLAYYNSADREEAHKWFRKAADCGDANG